MTGPADRNQEKRRAHPYDRPSKPPSPPREVSTWAEQGRIRAKLPNIACVVSAVHTEADWIG